MIRQHHAPGPHPNGFGRPGNMPDQHRSRGAADPLHIVVLGQPEPLKTQRLRMAGVGNAVGQRLAHGIALADRGELQQGKRHRLRHSTLQIQQTTGTHDF